MLRHWLGLAAILLTHVVGSAYAAASPSAFRSQRVVEYKIDARFDAHKNTINAHEVLVYHNLTGQPLETFPFHLYLNAFQPASTMMREVRRDRSDFEWQEKYRASMEVKSIAVTGEGDVTSHVQFVAPDDGNPADRTVFQIKLKRPVMPGQTVEFTIVFQDRLGEVFDRAGYKRDFVLAAQWFPKIGVWWRGKWNCHQYHADTEFFAEFGAYDVRLTVPQNEVVGASGDEGPTIKNPDGTKTITFHGEDIHDFAWTAEPEYRVVDGTFAGSAGPVQIRLLMQPGHMGMADRYMKVMQESMARFDHWYGAYPYKRITVVDPPHGGGRAGGMEYPTLFTGYSNWWMPRGWHFLEETAAHEFGHQYWYAMVATNEFEEAWLDEGINSYVELKIMDELYGADRSELDQWGFHAPERGVFRLEYKGSFDRDPVTRFAYQYLDTDSYDDITYGKSALVLLTLEKLIGEDTLRRAMRVYFERYRFTHPTTEDFLRTVEEVSGQNLRWYFDQAVYGTAVLDYEVLNADSDPVEGTSGGTYRTTVVVHRKGDFVFPVELLVKFDNGEVAHERWDGRDRWVRYSYQKAARLVSAEIDPGHGIWLDKDLFNNSYVATPNATSRKISAYWMLVTQFVAQVLAWLV
jgi:hypothetical protein